MAFYKISSSDLLFQQAQHIRQTVFVEEQGVSADLEHDIFDHSAQHYLLQDKDIFMATARSRITSYGIKLERFAVLSNKRGKGYGWQLLKHILIDLQESQRAIYLHAQIPVVDFYAKYGFVATGPIIVEANIEHYKMIFKP